jgi:hypothetical protein
MRQHTVLLGSPAPAPDGFRRMASVLGSSRNILKNPENSVAAPVPTVPANISCSTLGSGSLSRMRDTNSQERGEGNALASRSNALSSCGRKRMNAITSGRMPVLMAHSDHSCESTSESRCTKRFRNGVGIGNSRMVKKPGPAGTQSRPSLVRV